jgi:hypothetical protein
MYRCKSCMSSAIQPSFTVSSRHENFLKPMHESLFSTLSCPPCGTVNCIGNLKLYFTVEGCSMLKYQRQALTKLEFRIECSYSVSIGSLFIVYEKIVLHLKVTLYFSVYI